MYVLAAKNKYTARKSKNGPASARKSIEAPQGETKEGNELIVSANVMRLSGYQADPIAATMNTRSMGLAKINPTKE